MRRISAMLWKKEKSSEGVVSTARGGASHLWGVKGTEVSMVRVVVESEEIGRRRDRAAEMGLRRLDP